MQPPSSADPAAIAIIGLGCWYPGARDPRRLWENILARRQQFRRLPEARLPLADYYDPDPATPDKTYGTQAALIDGFQFDAVARRIPQAVVEATDVVHWLALEVALAALADAGYTRETVPTERTGVVLGNSLTGEQTRANTLRGRWPFVRRALEAAAQARRLPPALVTDLAATMEVYYKSVFAPVTEDTLAGGLSNTIAGRIGNFLNLDGGGYTVDGACASSLLAVATAATALAGGDLDLALAGGVDVSLDPFELIGFAKTAALSRAEMRVYDRRAGGFIPGEGCGFVVLKRLADARAAGDYVYAVLRGWGISSDGRGGITAPKRDGQATALRRAYRRAGYSPHTLAFIEGHGTGTPVGDRTELEAIALALADDGTPPPRSCGVTSLKSIVGHTKAAAGIGGLIKATLAVNRRVVPPTAGCDEPHPLFATAPALYPVRQGEIRDPGATIRAGVSAMGFGGINCHVTLESGDAPAAALVPDLPERALLVSHQATEIFVLAAPSVAALREQAQATRQLAAGLSVAELVDLAAHLAQEVTADAPLRAAVVAGTPEELADRLQLLEQMLRDAPPTLHSVAASPRQEVWVGHGTGPPRVGILFPGQGSQQLNMARVLVERFAWARDLVDQADRVVCAAGGAPISALIYRPLDRAAADDQHSEGTHAWAADLAQTEVAQPAICLASLLWLRYLEQLGVCPAAVGGHSLGELTAFHAAGAFDAATLLGLAVVRGRAMAAAPDAAGSMASLGCGREVAADLVQSQAGAVVVANVNSPRQVVISGPRAGVEVVIGQAAAAGIPARLLPVSNAFHSPLVGAAATLLRATAPVPETFAGGPVALFSGMPGAAGGSGAGAGWRLREHFAAQVLAPVDFVGLVQRIAPGCDVLLEVGPGRVLSSLAADILGPGGPTCLPVAGQPEQDRDLNTALAALFAHGLPITWAALYAGRLVRPFVPAAARVFITNPCERPFAVPTGELPLPAMDTGAEAQLAAAAGLSAAALDEYLARRGAFLGAVIQADLQTLPAPPTQNGHSPTVVPPVPNPLVLETRPAARVIAHDPGERVTDAPAPVAALLLDLAARRTGFPRDTLTLDLYLLDDLNLDSIKATELVAEAARRLGVAGQIDPAQFAKARLADVAAALLAPAATERQPEGTTPVAPLREDTSARNGSTPDPSPSWVRNFVVEHVAEVLPETGAAPDWTAATVLIVHEPGEAALAEVLGSCFQGWRARVTCAPFAEAPAQATDPAFTHRIALLPGATQEGDADEAGLRDAIGRLRAVAAPPAAAPGQPPATVAYIQFAGSPGVPRSSPMQGCATAFAASLHLERPDLKVRAVTLAAGGDPVMQADQVLAELATAPGYSTVGYDSQGARRVPRPRVQEPVAYPPRPISWSAADVVLVTGGAKGVTAACALGFAAATGVRLALVGSSPHPDADPTGAGAAEIAQTLAHCHAAGLTAHYYACDITDAAAVARLLDRVRQELGPITGVIHGAGLNRPRRVEQTTAADALAEVAPKVLGALNLCRALAAAPPRLIAGFGSIIGTTGMAGNAWYGFANEALAGILQGFGAAHPSTNVLTIAFSIWGEIGMGARMGSTGHLARLGVAAIPTAEGVRRFLHLMTHDPGAPQVIVAARLQRVPGGLDTWQPAPAPLPSAARYLEQIVYLEPGVEAVARAHLSLASDRYLADHVYKGTHLFPTVFGLEAMAQAVALVTGEHDFATLCIEDIRLERPIAVDPDNGTDIEIRAEVQEQDASGPARRVRAAIRTAGTGFARDHFAAVFVLNGADPAPMIALDLPETPLDIQPRTDLYSWLLFQGALYQRLQQIDSLDATTCHFHVAGAANAADFGGDVGGSLLLGDPYFRDALLQAPQLIVSQDICLPIRIDRLERTRLQGAPTSSYAGVAVFEGRVPAGAGPQVRASVCVVDEAGTVVERLTGYQLQIVEHHDEYPTPLQIADPGERDAALLRHELQRAAAACGVTPPAAALAYLPGLHRLPPEERHRREGPLIAAVAEPLLAAGAPLADPPMAWLASGKPVLAGPAGETMGVSLAHDDRACLCVAGHGPQGCDLAPVVARSPADWLALLGPSRAALLSRLREGGDALDREGTRIWAAVEAAYKATGAGEIDLALARQEGDTILLRAGTPGGAVAILTFPLRLLRGPERMVALVVPDRLPPAPAAPGDPAASVAAGLDYNPRSYGMEVTADGPQGQPVFTLRFPLTFREMANLSRSLYFSHIFHWMGQVRELACGPVITELAAQLAGGRWGMVTNMAATQIVGTAHAGDVIEGRLWLDNLSGQHESTMDLGYEWRKIGPDGRREPVAFSRMRATWVAIHDHGVVEPRPLPEYFRQFMYALRPTPASPSGSALPLDTLESELGPVLYRASAGPANTLLLREQVFETSLEDANLVGNIYFANYPLWQGRIRDRFFHDLAPGYYHSTGAPGELRCVTSQVDHLREAMPFARILVCMYLGAVHDGGVQLRFDYYRLAPDGSREKLAFGEQTAAWFAPRPDGAWRPTQLPAVLREGLLAVAPALGD